MLETSQDLFYLVLAFCVLWLAAFLCWALYYCVRLLKQTNEVMTAMRERIERVNNIFSIIKNKIVVQGVKGLVSLVSSFLGKQKSKNKK